jgi:nitrogen fixation protein FixH
MKSSFNPWPYSIIGFFALLICGIVTLIVIAVTHRESMVNANYYEQELRYQAQMESAARAQQCGASLQWDATGRLLRVAVPSAQLAQNLSGTIEFYRPSAPELDHSVQFIPGADGRQAVDVSKLAAGLWRVRLKWNAGGQNYFLEEKVAI